MTRQAHFAVEVPATTANVGVGFDCLGLALDLWAHFTFETADELAIDGCPERFRGPDNLVWTSYAETCRRFHEEPLELHITIESPIPLSGGLGSSSACVVAGIIAAQVLHSGAMDAVRALDIACELEGHPDNVAPAVFGGATVAWVERGGHPRMAPMPVDASLGVSLLIPPSTTRLSTKEARQVLPVSVPREDALFNTSRAAVLMLALAGRPDLLMAGTEDRLHQEYRRGVLPASMAVMDSLREQGYPAVISGAGPTVLVLSTLAEQTRFTLENHGWSVLTPGIDTRGAVLTS